MATADSTAVLGFAGFNRLSFLRQLGLMVGLAASVAVGFAVVLWSQEPDYRPLYDGMQYADATNAIEILESAEIKYRLDPRSGALLVESGQLHSARLKLAASGFNASQGVGLEVLEQEQSLGTSQFMETARYRRGLEGELGRTISNIHAVRTARVHLAIPKESVFIRDAKRPRASVFVELFAGRSLSASQVKAIRNMVAFSIPELHLDDVTIVDQQGNLLSTSEEGRELEQASRQLEYKKKLEREFNERVNSILSPIVGPGKYRAEVNIDVDFTRMEQTDEVFNPDLPSVRSEATIEEQRRGTEQAAGGVPGALANQPPADAFVTADNPGGGAAAEAAQNASTRRQSTRNYELDRTISHTQHQVGRIQRIAVAVVVDHKSVLEELPVPAEGEEAEQAPAEEGEAAEAATPKYVAEPWTEEELGRLTQLVRDTVGFNAARGDSVSVINAEFVREDEAIPLPEPAFWQQAWFSQLIKQVLGGLFVLLLVFGVLRPTLKNLSKAAPPAPPAVLSSVDDGLVENEKTDESNSSAKAKAAEMAKEAEAVALAEQEQQAMALGAQGEMALIPALQGSFDQQMDSIKDLIEQDPNRVAQVIKQWVADSE